MLDPSWLWAVFTIIAAAAQTVRNATQRELTAKLGTVGAPHVGFLSGFPFAVVVDGDAARPRGRPHVRAVGGRIWPGDPSPRGGKLRHGRDPHGIRRAHPAIGPADGVPAAARSAGARRDRARLAALAGRRFH